MSRDQELKERWDLVVEKLSNQFADGDTLDLDAIIYLIGVQELGKGAVEFKKDDKVIIPVNGEFSTRLAQQIEWAGGQTIKIKTEPGINASPSEFGLSSEPLDKSCIPKQIPK